MFITRKHLSRRTMLRAAGFSKAARKPLTFGIVTIYIGIK